MRDVTTGTEYYYVPQDMHSVSALADASGHLVESYRYDVYGKVTMTDAHGHPIEQSAVGNPYFFTGRWLDFYSDSAGQLKQFYDYRARTYDPENGRFLQRDPKGYVDGGNLYEAFGSNPARFCDPYGMFGLERGHQRPFPRTGEYFQPWDMLPQIRGNPEAHDRFMRGRMLRRQLADEQCEGNRWTLVAGACEVAPTVIPYVNDGVDYIAMATGEDPSTGEELEYWERGFYAGGLVFGNGRWYKELYERLRPIVGPRARRVYDAVSHKADDAWDWVNRKVLRRGGDKIDDVGAATKGGKEYGSYTNLHQSGKKYHGQGDRTRSQVSGREKAGEYNDPHAATEWTPAESRREAMKDEARRLEADGGVENPNNYNRINSPGRRYLEEDGN